MPANEKTEANKAGASSGLAVGAGFGEARPHTQRPAAFQAWFDRLKADNECWQLNNREQAVAFAAFIAGWYLRTGENPDSFSVPNDQGEPRSPKTK